MKRILLPAILVALAMLVAACGGDDKQDGPAPAAATSEPAQPQQPATDAREPETAERPSHTKNGDGGSSASDAEAATGEDAPAAPATKEASKESKPATRKRKRKLTPQEGIAALSPAERRKLHKDLYDQGKRLCAAYGPEELAKSIDIPSRDPQTVARLYARAYEAATPSLALPYQQGCLVGFKRYARAHKGN